MNCRICHFRLDPLIVTEGYDTHPGCDRPATPQARRKTLADAEWRKSLGQQQAWQNSPGSWRNHAKWSLWNLAQSGREFTADDVIAEVGLPNPSWPGMNNAVGALFSLAARKHVIVRVGDERTTRVTGNARRVSRWVGAERLL